MSDYKTRMADEYRQLVDRSEKLRAILAKQADGTLDFKPTCPIELLRHQLDVMDEYANTLRRRAEIEHVSPYLSIWSPVPKWLVWLRWHKRWKTERSRVLR